VEREAGAITLLLDFEIIEEPADIGKKEVADLRLLVERGLNLRKGGFSGPNACRQRKARPESA
jgi:hypothetical protein